MYHTLADLVQQSEATPLHRIILENEMQLSDCTEAEVCDRLRRRWQVMEQSARRALNAPQMMQPALISGQSARQQAWAETDSLCGAALNRMMAMALSSSEVNAAMGRICAAPTAGACGILPAVLLTAAEQVKADEAGLLHALLVASGVGAVITKNATVSGAEGGCQAECGVAAAMAAAGAVYLRGGSARQCVNAAAIALVNCMGLVCDPVAGLVQLPCSFRNASQSMNALASADLALAGQDPIIPPDEVVEAMYRVGKSLPSTLRETAEGGIAATPTGKKLAAEL